MIMTTITKMKQKTLLNNVINQTNLNETVNELLKQAHGGDAFAHAALGISFLNGDYDRIDAQTAVSWIELFLKENGPSKDWAIFSEAVGICYFEEIGKKANNKKAFEHLEVASKFNRPIATYYLADFYLEGIGTKADPKKAFKLYTEAAKKIKTEPLIFLKIGNLYYSKKDLIQAKKMYEKASKLGSDDASFNLILLLSEMGKMTKKSISLAQTLIDSDHPQKSKLKKLLSKTLWPL